ncbi:hypothetical protein H8958_014303, partial [Nasalis larvatus]
SATGIHGAGPTSCATLKDLENPCQEQAVVLDSRAVKISRLNNTIKSLVRVHVGSLRGAVHQEEESRGPCCLLPFSAEPLPPEPPAVAPEEELQHLRKELERVSAELQAQVENHQHVSLLNQAQKERLREQEERLREQEERLQQLAEPQSGVEELNNENKSTLHLEQQVEELQQKLREVETVTSTHKEPEAAVPAPGTGGE